MTTLDNIQSRIQKLQAQAEALISKRASAVLDDIHELMKKYGLTAADLDAHTPGKKRRGRPAKNEAAKPESKLQGSGKKLKSAAKGETKGKLPAKYRNPQTGETWSGWARPPVWIKDAKNRNRFLINGADADAPVKLGTKKNAAAKKVGAKATITTTPVKKVASKKTAANAKNGAGVKAVAKKATTKKLVASKVAVPKKAPGRKAAVKAAPQKSGLRKTKLNPAANGKGTAPQESVVSTSGSFA
jgi:DNA-binding protein H-NS